MWVPNTHAKAARNMQEDACIPACEEFVGGVATRDVQIPSQDGNHMIWARLFLPKDHADSINGTSTFPVVLYAHGGAYCSGRPDSPAFHRFCVDMAIKSSCLWISLAYRLAPAHRLPAAFDDGFSALLWLRSQARAQQQQQQQKPPLGHGIDEFEPKNIIDHELALLDPWLGPEVVDFSRLFLAGESAGATIMFNVTMRTANHNPRLDLSPLQIQGLLFIHPGFHTEAKRGDMVDRSDISMNRDPVLSNVEERYKMALPLGETLDYPGINPMSPRALPRTPLSTCPNLLICLAELDFRNELAMRFYEEVKGICENVDLFITPRKGHIFHLYEPDCVETRELESYMVEFIKKCCI